VKKAFVQLHTAVFLAGFTAILGRLILLNESVLVWYRLLITAGCLWLIYLLNPARARPGKAAILKAAGIGIILTLHWITFYGAIKYSTVSVTLVCFSAIGFFTALIEPLLTRRRINPSELLLGLIVVAGISLVLHFDPHYKTGIIIGLVSALLGSIFPVLSRQLLRTMEVNALTLYELSGGFVFLSLLLPVYLKFFPVKPLFPAAGDWFWLLILSLVCTVYAFTLSMKALLKISAFTVNLTYNLEPVYGIALAFIFFREDKEVNHGFYYGLALILAAIVLQMVRLLYAARKQKAGPVFMQPE
jgi:drug/metabolite transporter (DMT)-like permease